MENNFCDFRGAIEAQWEFGRDAAADVHERRIAIESSAGVLHAVAAGAEDRTGQGQANLTAVGVTGEHQVEIIVRSPGELIGRVRQQ